MWFATKQVEYNPSSTESCPIDGDSVQRSMNVVSSISTYLIVLEQVQYLLIALQELYIVLQQ